jgi:single-strand DNA-binding protein
VNDTVQKHAPPGLPKRMAWRYRSINKVRITGRLTHPPEVRSAIGDKLIVHMDLALNRTYQSKAGKARQEVTYVPVTVWDRLAADTTGHLQTGNPVYVEGRLRSDRWKTSTGEVRCALRVEAAKLQPLAIAA